MVILDYPYVSDYLQKSLAEANIPVIQTDSARKLGLSSDLNWISEEDAIKAFKTDNRIPLYTNSENAISWISKNLAFTDLPDKINIFKDKVRFRKLISHLYPDYYFKEVLLADFDKLNKEDLPYPLILKPAVGFFSLGVYKLNSHDDWQKVQSQINNEITKASQLYPDDVFNSSRFILEECIPGREFAIDTYFNEKGETVIMNISEHYFGSSEDLGDRLYQSRPELFDELYSPFLSKLQTIGDLAQLKNFPVHVEVRLRPDGAIIPIEVNPMRFGGWCTTADLAGLSYDINPIEMFLNQEKPDWDQILSSRKGKAYNLVLLDNITGIPGDKIQGFDYDKLSSRFRNVMDIRKIDYTKFPVFGFLLVQTDLDEEPILAELLKSDLREYLV
jgi:hypothetical protein